MYNQDKQDKEKSPLRKLREGLGLTRPQVKQVINVSERRQADWEDGKAIPSMENAASLARLYKVSLKALYKAVGIDTSGIPDDLPHR